MSANKRETLSVFVTSNCYNRDFLLDSYISQYILYLSLSLFLSFNIHTYLVCTNIMHTIHKTVSVLPLSFCYVGQNRSMLVHKISR
jgi:flagellar biosynthesis protein FliR